MLVHWIWLAHRPNLTDWLRWQILQKFGTPEAVYFADSYEGIEELTTAGYEALQDKNLRESERILETCVNKGLHIMTLQDRLYPDRLRNIPDPPLILYYKGRMPDLDTAPAIGVVGTRRATPYGLQAARRMGYQIGKCGGIVVSGMAWGIDAMAMNGALLGNAPVIGVLGCGADQIYPVRNRTLFADTERYGCILSEYPPGTPALAWHFPRRNRIISGLSNGVLVVEAPLKSGALITAHQALDQGRDVFVVPGNVGVAACEGSNRLLREGAGAVGCGWDIVSEYEHLYPDTLREDGTVPEPETPSQVKVAQPRKMPEKRSSGQRNYAEKIQPSPEKSGKAPIPKDKLGIDKTAPQPYIDINDILKACNSQEKAIVEVLSHGETLVDDVIAQTGLKPQDVLASMTMLEIKGILQRHPGRRISLRQNPSKRSN